jgi:hypothetical protein
MMEDFHDSARHVDEALDAAASVEAEARATCFMSMFYEYAGSTCTTTTPSIMLFSSLL